LNPLKRVEASDKQGVVHGGHFVKGKCSVLITCEVAIIRVKGVSLLRRMDPEVGWKVLYPQICQENWR
jgi:predicted DNA-binding protein with PD1-like motif